VASRWRAPLTAAVAVAVMALGGGVSAQGVGLGTPQQLQAEVGGSHGTGRIDPGLSCAEGGKGGYWHYDYDADLPAGVITADDNPLPGKLRMNLDVHSEEHTIRATPGEPIPGSAWLQGTESAVTLVNQRGTVTLELQSDDSGDCALPHGLTFDGLTASGAGTWQITDSTGSYRDAVGSGIAGFNADVSPGADNPFSVSLDGDIAVLQPDLQLEVVDTYWAFLGVHYLTRVVTVIFRVTNTGPGDAYNVWLTGADSPTEGVVLIGPLPLIGTIPGNPDPEALGPVPQYLADLPSGDSTIVRLRFQLPLPSGDPPCETIILGCEFDATLTFDMPDTLDVVEAPKSATVHARAPDFPPPVVD